MADAAPAKSSFGFLKYALPVVGALSLGLIWAGAVAGALAAAPAVAQAGGVGAALANGTLSFSSVLQTAFSTAASGIGTHASTVLEAGKVAAGKALTLAGGLS